MSDLKKVFEKAGGWTLISEYWRAGTFVTAIVEFVLLGKSRTALEILRLATQLKVKMKLQNKYLCKLRKFDEEYDDILSHETSDKIWVCWFQGIENAPELVRKCYQSLQMNLADKEIILITSKNLNKYVQFPKFILEKWEKGLITNTHMTDLLRLELLIHYGGMWIDATVLCTSKKIPDYYFDSDIFFYQSLKPGRDGHSHINSSWLICAKTNNKLLLATRYLCYEYWKDNNLLIDYFLFHDFMAIVLEFYPEDCKKIIPCCNSLPHILLLRLFDPYDEKMWEYIKGATCFHKLSYKFSNINAESRNTYYEKILKG